MGTVISVGERCAYNALSSFPLCLSVKRAPVAQRTERVASDHQVAGSIPAGRAIFLSDIAEGLSGVERPGGMEMVTLTRQLGLVGGVPFIGQTD